MKSQENPGKRDKTKFGSQTVIQNELKQDLNIPEIYETRQDKTKGASDFKR